MTPETITLFNEVKSVDAAIKELMSSVPLATEDRKIWNDSQDRVRWYQQADEMIDHLIEEYSPEVVIILTCHAIKNHKCPFDTQKMKSFERLAAIMRIAFRKPGRDDRWYIRSSSDQVKLLDYNTDAEFLVYKLREV